MTANVSELRQFSADLRALSNSYRTDARRVMERGANNIKRQLRRDAELSAHFSQIARAINYDVIDNSDSIEIEVGPTKGSPGSLANIAYFGGSRGGGTVADPEVALMDEAPNLERHLADLLVEGML